MFNIIKKYFRKDVIEVNKKRIERVYSGREIHHKYEETPFSIKCYEIDHGKGYWKTWRVDVLKDNIKIGEYERQYSCYIEDTFYPFELNNNWYALYSDNYTTTKIAKLTDKFQFWCGEDPNPYGFCPVEFYIPKFYFVNNEEVDKEEINENDLYECKYINYGFVSGCVWGDDSSWKLRFIDLSKIEDKIFEINEKFGYLQLPNKKLKDCIEIYEYDSSIIRIHEVSGYNIR